MAKHLVLLNKVSFIAEKKIVKYLLFLMLLSSQAFADNCNVSVSCPVTDPNLLSEEMTATSMINGALACHRNYSQGKDNFVDKTKNCLTSLTCIKDTALESVQGVRKAARFVGCLTTVYGIMTCGSESAEAVRQVPVMLGRAADALKTLEPATARTVLCTLGGEMETELMLSLTTPAGWAKSALRIELLVAKIQKLAHVLRGLGKLPDKAIQELTKLDTHDLDNLLKKKPEQQRELVMACALK